MARNGLHLLKFTMGQNNELGPWKEVTAVTKLTIKLEKDSQMGSHKKKKKHGYRVRIAARKRNEYQNNRVLKQQTMA